MICTCDLFSNRRLIGLALLSMACAVRLTGSEVALGPITPPTAKMELSSVKGSGLNLIKNGDFEEGVLAPWLPAVSAPASGRFGVNNGKACVSIEYSGANPYDVLLRQRPILIRRHREYTLSLTAQSTTVAKIRPQLVLVGSPPVELWSAILELGPKEQSWAAKVKITEPTNSDAEFVIHFGGALQSSAPTTICVDVIALEDPEQAPAQATELVPKLRVNQVGYVPKFSKIAVMKSASNQPLEWALVDSSGKFLLKGKTKVIGEDSDAGEMVHQIDFSNFRQAGSSLTLVVGTEKSDKFDVKNETFKKLKFDALAFFYHQRSGVSIDMPHAGAAAWVRPAGHVQDNAVSCAPGSGCNYKLDVSGGWYDAGDHGKYVVNGGISVWTLLNLYERTKLHGSSLPDLLDEARWELEFLMKMQVPPGHQLSGMAHHKIHSERWTPIPTAPQADSVPRYLRPPSTAATLNLAAVGAQCARVYREGDKAFADRCLVSAERAWQAAEAHPSVYARGDDKEGGGPYGDTDVTDEKYWAAVELLVTTGKTQYLKAVKQSPHYLKMPTQAGGGLSSISWANVAGCGTATLAVVASGLPASEVIQARKNIVSAAKRYVDASTRTGYRIPFTSSGGRYPWGSNSFILNNGVVLGLAYDFTKRGAFLDGAVSAMDYVLGRNAMAKSYVSAYGTRALQNPHHRFWAHQSNPEFPPPPPGVVSGGPNSGVEDPAAKEAGLGGCAPQKCYFDNIDSWSTNEVAINWNAPLVWLAAFLDEKAQEP